MKYVIGSLNDNPGLLLKKTQVCVTAGLMDNNKNF